MKGGSDILPLLALAIALLAEFVFVITKAARCLW